MSQAPLVLVDGSSYLYRAFHALPPLTTSKGLPTGAVKGVLNMLKSLRRQYPNSPFAVVFDAKGGTFRDELYAEYKANRASMPDDMRVQIEPLHQSVIALGFPLLCVEGVEADDVIGTLAEREAARPDTSVAIVSGDRDLYQLVRDPEICVLYPIKGVSEMLRVDEAEVTRRYKIPGRHYADFAVLRGDPSDGLPGVKGIGEKTAASLLNTYGSLDEIIKAAQANPGAGALSRVASHLDYVDRARRVVAIPRDLPLPDVDLDRPRKPPIPEVTALA
ncbi:MAG: 5'-3' exonuclease, partial [Pseudomonas sp.]